MLLLPWWIYVCIIGIILSGYMAFKTHQQDKEIDDEFIEKEGQVYIERIELERQKKQALVEQQQELQEEQSVG
ncbi:sporulation YhaL family protein [Metabacillus litoralis]|uniref:sporulation YhaL family protein n=1 Tax=Metabacillus litoralis TaxID=152268 RepID=UPI001CFDAFF8|nr:sporulation YhaL family protein [Metabacillus litoralis]